jgi:hypothetical protein
LIGRGHLAVACHAFGWHYLLLTSLTYLVDSAPPGVFLFLLGFGAGLVGLGHWLGLPQE